MLIQDNTGCWQHKWPSKFLTLMKNIFLKPFWHKDSSDVCSFVQIHPYFFTIVSASIFLLTLADFAYTFIIFKKMLLCRDGFGKNYECHLILHDLGVSKKYILSVLDRNFYGHYTSSTLWDLMVQRPLDFKRR